MQLEVLDLYDFACAFITIGLIPGDESRAPQFFKMIVDFEVVVREQLCFDPLWSVLESAASVGERPQSDEEKPGLECQVSDPFGVEKLRFDGSDSCHCSLWSGQSQSEGNRLNGAAR